MRPKVLILYNGVQDYRVPILNIVADKYDLTIAFNEGKAPKQEDVNFKIIHLKQPKKLGPLIIHRENISKLCDDFDAVISIGELQRVKFAYQAFRPFRKFKYAVWTIGVSASYTKHYDEVTKWDWIRDIFYKKSDACIFYTDYPVKKNIIRGYNPETMFVAHNTVQVLPLLSDITKDSILFIGSLYKEKGIQILLDQYIAAYNINDNIPKLNIIGGGTEYDSIKKWIENNNLGHKIHLIGPVFDKTIKRQYFQQAYACISPLQAGLSVLESMGYGVPFITTANAYTGGERFNIINGENGILLDDANDLSQIILDIADSPEKYLQMGQRSYKHYCEKRTPQIMAKGITDCIEYMLSKKV